MKKRILASNQLACVVTYGAIKSSRGELWGVDFHSTPQVGEFGHWNLRKVIPCQVVNGQYVDLRTGETVATPGNSAVWPLLHGTVITYPDGQKLLLSHRYFDGATLLTDVTDKPVSPMSTSLIAKN